MGLRPQAPERAIQPLFIITRGCDKKCLFWDVLGVLVEISWNVPGVLLMLWRGAWSSVDILECT